MKLTFGSCTKAPPLDPGGSSPDVAYLRHSIIVYKQKKYLVAQNIVTSFV